MEAGLNPSEVSQFIKERIGNLDLSGQDSNRGIAVKISDGIVQAYGLSAVQNGELVEFDSGVKGIALNLERNSVGIALFSDYDKVNEGSSVVCTKQVVSVGVGEALLGRVVDSLGVALDGKGEIKASEQRKIEVIAPGVISRESVGQPLATGLKAIDSMVPIGRGQRELIIGDRQMGKTSVAIDTIINQRGKDVKCIYVAIGQKQSSIAAVVRKLEQLGAMEHTIVLCAPAASSALMQYLSVYAGCAMGEYFRDKGEDALIVYDDLTKHAWAYRQISLLLKRPPGREAYPGDIFYQHSKLLERAARVNASYVTKVTGGKVKGRTGSLTALPIIETQAGDVSAFIPTNVISITDGQIYLNSDFFNSGIRPAIDPGISVSRVGGAAQSKIIKKLGGGIRLSLAQYRELAAFSQFASDLDETTRKQLEHGQRVTKLMVQSQYSPLSLAEQAISLFAANEGFLDDVEVEKVNAFEKELHKFMNSTEEQFVQDLNESGAYNSEIEEKLTAIIGKFKQEGSW